VLEAGYKIQHEPSSIVLHSHDYPFLDILRRNVDDGIANREIVGRELLDGDVVPTIHSMVVDDWHYLREKCQLDASELDSWCCTSAVRRTAQIAGQWIGTNEHRFPGDPMALLSLTARIKAGAQEVVATSTETQA